MSEVRAFSFRSLWNRFFFAEASQERCGVFRIVYASLLLINLLMWWPDLNRWFGETGVLDYEASRQVIDPDTFTLLAWLPQTSAMLWGVYLLLIGHTLFLMVGYYTRFQALAVFVWFTAFQHRNLLIFDAEDYLFRILAFLLIFLPAGKYYALDSRKLTEDRIYPIWPLRLAQIQVCLVYVSSAWEKLRGEDWVDGLALYYASRLDSLFGRFPMPGILLESLFLMKLATWTVLVLECFIPLGLWFRETRRWAICAAIALHLSLEYTMNLFLFQPLMLACLLLFMEGSVIRRRLVKDS